MFCGLRGMGKMPIPPTFYSFTFLLLNKKESMFHTYMQLRMEHTLNILFQK